MKNFFMMVLMMAGFLAMCGLAVAAGESEVPVLEQPQMDVSLQGEAAPAAAAVLKEQYADVTVSGEVSGIGKRYISIVTDRDYDTGAEMEVMIPVTDQTAFNRVKGLSGIKRGDLVSIQYKKPVAGSKGMAYAETVNFIQAGSAPASQETGN